MINPSTSIPLSLKELGQSRFHFIGIGGSGMLPIAQALAGSGFKVSGSDKRPLPSSLQNTFDAFQQGHEPITIQGADVVIVSSAISKDNPELVWATENKLKIAHRSDALNALMKNAKLSLGVSGTSGKTTTSGLCVAALEGFSPRALGVLGASPTNSGQDKHEKKTAPSEHTLVAELDESDGSIVKYAPDCMIVHNIDRDHLGTYGSVEKLNAAFLEAALNLPKKAALAVNWDHRKCRELFRAVEEKRPDLKLVSYGASMGCDLRLLDRKVDGKNQRMKLQCFYETTEATVPGIGAFMAHNTLAALAGALALGQSLGAAVAGIEGFRGLSRRMQLVAKEKTVLVSDYAHNPEKIAAAIEGFKESYPDKKITVVFQPHRFSRTEELWDDFLLSFKKADLLYVLPTFSAGETKPQRFSLESFGKAVEGASKCKTSLLSVDSFRSLGWLNLSSTDTAYIALGAGDIHSLLCESLKIKTH